MNKTRLNHHETNFAILSKIAYFLYQGSSVGICDPFFDHFVGKYYVFFISDFVSVLSSSLNIDKSGFYERGEGLDVGFEA